MHIIGTVTITAQSALYFRGVPAPDSDSAAFLHANPGSVRVAVWQAGILSLDLPDGARRRIPCRDLAEAIDETTRVWNTAAGQIAIAHRLGTSTADDRWAEEWRQYEAEFPTTLWLGERRHEWQEMEQLIGLVRAALRQAVKDGILPGPDDYCVTWDGSGRIIGLCTRHVMSLNTEKHANFEDTLWTLLLPLNALRVSCTDITIEMADSWFESYPPERLDSAIEMADFFFESYPPEHCNLAGHVAAMERAGFSAAAIAEARNYCARFPSTWHANAIGTGLIDVMNKLTKDWDEEIINTMLRLVASGAVYYGGCREMARLFRQLAEECDRWANAKEKQQEATH